MEIQLFKLEDEQNKRVELKDLYNSVMRLNEQYYLYYRNMCQIDRKYRGNIINEKLSQLLDLVSNSYFDKEHDYLSEAYLLTCEIEFQIRILYKIKSLPNKSKTILQIMFADIKKQIKSFK